MNDVLRVVANVVTMLIAVLLVAAFVPTFYRQITNKLKHRKQ